MVLSPKREERKAQKCETLSDSEAVVMGRRPARGPLEEALCIVHYELCSIEPFGLGRRNDGGLVGVNGALA